MSNGQHYPIVSRSRYESRDSNFEIWTVNYGDGYAIPVRVDKHGVEWCGLHGTECDEAKLVRAVRNHG